MAAGLGFKDFVTGEVLTAADVDGYLMQGVWVFASAAARDAAVTSPQEGNFAYLKDTNVTTYYTGSAWANLDTTGMTNPMTTTGDSIYSSSGSTPARLGIGSTGQVLTVAGGIPSWATPASGGGMTLIAETVANADASISYSSLGSYKQLFMTWSGLYQGSDTGFSLRLNNDSSGIYQVQQCGADDASVLDEYNNDQTSIGGSIRLPFGKNTPNTKNERSQGSILIDNYTSTTKYKQVYWQTSYKISASIKVNINARVMYESTSAITSLDIVRFSGAGTLSNSTSTSIRLYGIS
jgi:hypothetical protein